MIVQEPVQAAIWHCLNHCDYPDAIFLSERLYAEVNSEDSLFLLATSYYRNGQLDYAYNILKDKSTTSVQCRYLLGHCAYELQKYSEAECAISSSDINTGTNFEELIVEYGEHAAFVLLLLAKVAIKTERRQRALEAYKRALKLNPFLWSCFQSMCNMGEKPNPFSYFNLGDLDNLSQCHGTNYYNTDSVILNNSNNINEIEENFNTTTPQQILSSSNPVNNNFNSSKIICTPEHTTLITNPLCMSGFSFIPPTKGKQTRLGRRLLDSSGSPMPSFGTLLDRGDDFLSSPQHTQPTLTEANEQQPPFSRRAVRSFNNYNISRRETSVLHTSHHNLNVVVGGGGGKPPLVTQQQVQPAGGGGGGNNNAGGGVNNNNNNNGSSGGLLHLSTPTGGGGGVVNTGGGGGGVVVQQVAVGGGVVTGGTVVGQNVRRSSRLFSNSYSVKENNKSPNRNKFATPKSPSRKTKSKMTNKCNFNEITSYLDLNTKNRLKKDKTAETVTSTHDSKSNLSGISNHTTNTTHVSMVQLQKHSAEGLMALLRELGTAYAHLAGYECRSAVDALARLPSHHHHTAWVQTLLARAHFEMAEYEQCARYFAEVRARAPYRIEEMDVYSTALWHLQREVALSALAQDLIQLDKHSPITWIANGNCFSLHKEHDTAIKFLHRAVQVDPSFPYAYTLLGHEYITTEELDKAMSCYRSAIRLEPRHYNAWFGIGTIYAKQERFHLAEMNYARALGINRQSSVIMCHIGMVQHALKKTDQALTTLNRAISHDADNPLCKFQRGSIYLACGRHSDALRELEQLKELVPRESLVYYLIGNIHKKLGNTDLALMHFSWATDLDPKGASSQIKEAFDPTAVVVTGGSDNNMTGAGMTEENGLQVDMNEEEVTGGEEEESVLIIPATPNQEGEGGGMMMESPMPFSGGNLNNEDSDASL